MRQYLSTWQVLEQHLAERYGAFMLFALLEREDASNLWDIVVAAPWLEHLNIDALDVIAKAINEHFDRDIYHHISHIALVDMNHPDLPVLLEMVANERQQSNSMVTLYQRQLLGKDIARAFIISAQPANTRQLVGN